MTKKTPTIYIIALFAIFLNITPAFSIEENIPLKKYPDYSFEFSGKDKFENLNRKIFVFNSKVNKYIVKPINIVWASVMPKYGMERIQSAYTNVEYPIRLVSCLLQKDFKASGTETLRFLTNTTLGLGGLYDPAAKIFKIEPKQEDMAQALAHYKKIKQGPYLVLPVVAQGNLRDLAGKLLDCPLNPTSYVVGPIPAIAKAVLLVNKTAGLQSFIKTVDMYADPYDITKKVNGIERFIKNKNLDRSEVLAQKTIVQNFVPVKNITINPNLKADINLDNYNPQCPVTDSLRTALFDNKEMKKSIWSDLSVWNRTFSKKIKTSSINIDDTKPNYKYRYILQANKNSPLAVIYPSIGEGINSHHSDVIAKMFYDAGYSIVIQGSAFHWEFVKSMPEDYRPGLPSKDAEMLSLVTSKIIQNIQTKKGYSFDNKVITGTSFGALTALFVAAQDKDENQAGTYKYISINPPVDILYAIDQIDKYAQEWQNSPEDIKMQAAVTVGKILQTYQQLVADDSAKNPNSLPFTEDESKLIISYIMKQKLSDVAFVAEKCSVAKKNEAYKSICNMNYRDYAESHLLINEYKSQGGLNYDTSLYAIADFLRNNNNYKIYHALDDYLVNSEQLVWLKEQCGDKAIFFNHGSHLGFLYRPEFLEEFKKDINNTENTVAEVPEHTIPVHNEFNYDTETN